MLECCFFTAFYFSCLEGMNLDQCFHQNECLINHRNWSKRSQAFKLFMMQCHSLNRGTKVEGTPCPIFVLASTFQGTVSLWHAFSPSHWNIVRNTRKFIMQFTPHFINRKRFCTIIPVNILRKL